jgi:GDSL-like lipase/acylhydrolase family protein
VNGRLLIAAGASIAVAVCSGGGWAAPGASSVPADVGYPNSIVALGHSVIAAFDSDPAHPHIDARANSWATGTNPDVDSVYRRLLSANPTVEGHNLNLAKDGANVTDLLRQARRLASLKGTPPDLVVIQIMDNDIHCDGTDPKNFAPFGATFARALGVIGAALPDARIFVISQIGRSSTLADALGSTPASRAQFSGIAPCDFFDRLGHRNDAHIRYLDEVTAGYERQLASVCRTDVHCRYASMHGYVDDLADLSEDLNHFAISGQARLAALAWSSMFDFTDVEAPVSRATVTHRGGVKVVSLAASDTAGIAGIEYKLAALGTVEPRVSYHRYSAPVRVARGRQLLWRAVDVNGNSEAAHRLPG